MREQLVALANADTRKCGYLIMQSAAGARMCIYLWEFEGGGVYLKSDVHKIRAFRLLLF